MTKKHNINVHIIGGGKSKPKKDKLEFSVGVKVLVWIIVIFGALVAYLWGFGDGFRLVHDKSVSIDCDIMQRLNGDITFYGKDGIQSKLKWSAIKTLVGYNTKTLEIIT